jgi:NTP pyrophosphatase (non-canonical NTP hydrolase)
MDFTEYQRRTADTRIYRDKIESILKQRGLGVLAEDDFQAIASLLNMSYAGLGMGEVGELQGKLKKILRDSGGVITDEVREAVKGELGDALWYLAATADEFGLDLGDVAESNIAKLSSRFARGTIEGSGDDR